MKSQCIVFCLAALFLTACVGTGSSRDVTSAEKALTYLNMGVRYMGMGELKIAKDNLEKALDLDSRNPEIHNAAAALYEKIQEPAAAREHYQKALSLVPEDPQTQNNYGRFLCESGAKAEGLQYLKAALNMPLNNRRWFALTNAGRCLAKQGEKVQAEAYLREALQIYPDYSPALLEMMKLAYNDGKYMTAKAFAQRYQGAAQANPEFLWYAMQTEYALDHRNLAEQYKTSLLNDFPSSDEAKRVKTAVND